MVNKADKNPGTVSGESMWVEKKKLNILVAKDCAEKKQKPVLVFKEHEGGQGDCKTKWEGKLEMRSEK